MEEWRDVGGFEGIYQVSNLGRIKSLSRQVPRRDRCGRPGILDVSEKILAQPLNGPYALMRLVKDGKGHSLYAHRLVCMAFHGPPPSPKHQASHINGNSVDNRADNLVWETAAENHARKIDHGTAPRGERNNLARLKEIDVLEIRRRASLGEIAANIARDYSVSRECIYSVVTRKTWAHVGSEELEAA